MSEWRKLLRELWAESIYINSYSTFFFLSVISKVRNYSLRLISPPVRVAQDATSLLSCYDRAMNFYTRDITSCFIPKILLDIGRKEKQIVKQKDIPRYVRTHKSLHLISMAEKCPILIYPYDSTTSNKNIHE